MTTIGWLYKGDLFKFNGRTYKLGNLIDGTDGYVACTDIETRKVTRLYIDTEVEPIEKEIAYGESVNS